MEWDRQFEIDVAFIDEQHRQWFAHVARLGRAIEQGESNGEMAKALKFVVDYTHMHFAKEEAFMQEIGYPGLATQKSLHKAFEKYVVDVLLNLKKGKSVPPVRFYQFMSDWIKKHIQEEDQKIRQGIGDHVTETDVTLTHDAVTDDVVTDDADAAIGELFPEELSAKLEDLKEWLASDLITGEDFESKKHEMVQQFVLDLPADEPGDSMTKLDKIKLFCDKGLLNEDDFKIARKQLAQSVDLSRELAGRDGFKAKMVHLKNLLGEKIISADQFEGCKAELLEKV